MNLIVYIDVYFAINLSMDFIVLKIVSRLTMIKCSIWRVLAGSLVGSTATCLLLMNPSMHSLIRQALIYIIIPFIMVFLTFGKVSRKNLFLLLLYLYGITVVLGGLLCAVFFNHSFSGSVRKLMGVSERQSISLIALVISVALVLMCLPYLVHYLSTIHKRMNNIFEVSLLLEGKSVATKGLLDTGNHLREPITNKPAVIVEKQLLEKIMTKSLLEYTTRIRIVPFRSIGKEKGVMYALVIDQMTVYVNQEKHEFHKVLACVYEGTLSSKKDYQLILHEELI